jgi:hypothetical protein
MFRYRYIFHLVYHYLTVLGVTLKVTHRTHRTHHTIGRQAAARSTWASSTAPSTSPPPLGSSPVTRKQAAPNGHASIIRRGGNAHGYGSSPTTHCVSSVIALASSLLLLPWIIATDISVAIGALGSGTRRDGNRFASTTTTASPHPNWRSGTGQRDRSRPMRESCTMRIGRRKQCNVSMGTGV